MTPTLRRFVPSVIIAGAGVFVPAGSAHACSCGELTIDEAFAAADAVFVGSLTEVRRSPATSTDAPARFIFDVDRVLLGDVYETQSIVSPVSGSSCGIEVQMNTSSIIFARSDEQGFDLGLVDGEYSSTLCDGNVPAASASVAALGDGMSPLAGSSPIGSDVSPAATLVRYRFVLIGAVVGLAAILFTARRRRTEQRPVGEAGS